MGIGGYEKGTVSIYMGREILARAEEFQVNKIKSW
jgi:hypothetical protein